MRWVVISLLLLNLAFFLKNWLEFNHAQSLVAMNGRVLSGFAEDMPGIRLTLLSERKKTTILGKVAIKQNENSAITTEDVSGVKGNLISEASNVEIESATEPTIKAGQFESNMCTLLGPHLDDISARELIGELAALQIQAKYAAIQIAGEPDYWVYLIPEPTRELAAVKLRELQEKKIDSFLIPQGDIANGISLGVFDKRENAERHQQTIVELGYDAKLRSNPRNYLENWVVVYPDQAPKLSSQVYEQLRARNNKLDLRKEQCNKVASIIDIH